MEIQFQTRAQARQFANDAEFEAVTLRMSSPQERKHARTLQELAIRARNRLHLDDADCQALLKIMPESTEIRA